VNRRRRSHDSGQSLVEFALVLPFLLLVLVGIFKVGTIYLNDIQVTNAVDVGAREFAVNGLLSSQGQLVPCTDAVNSMHAVDASLTSNLTVSIQTTSEPSGLPDGPSWSTAAPTAPCPTQTPGDKATVTGIVPCDLTVLDVTIPCGPITVTANEYVQ